MDLENNSLMPIPDNSDLAKNTNNERVDRMNMNPFVKKSIDEIDPKRMKYYEKNYDVISSRLLNSENYIYLGDEHSKVCRFCGKSESDGATFIKLAHAFPESIGNKCLATYYECDKCNEKFGKTIECVFGNYMKFYHSISKIIGKKEKIPEYISNDNKSKSTWLNDTYVLSDTNELLHTSIDENNNSICYHATAPTHIPIAVYKCFVKMALSVMPENELEPFKETITWISEKKHKNIFENKKLICRYEMIPGYNTTVYPCYVLYKRKGPKSLAIIPYMIFNLTYGNFSYMIEVPTIEDTKQSIANVKFPPHPFVTSSFGTLDLTSAESVSNFEQSMIWSFDGKKIELNEKNLYELQKQVTAIKK